MSEISKKDRVLSRVKKLLALSQNNPSKEEALSAALMAQKLMAKYNIKKDDLMEEITDNITSVFSGQGKAKKWRQVLATILAGNFRCKAYIDGEKNDIVFRGYKADADICLEVYRYMYAIGDELAKRACKEHHIPKEDRKDAYYSYIMGFLNGVDKTLGAQCTALMIVTPKEVEEDFKSFTEGFGERKVAFKVTDAELYQKGVSEGKEAIKSRQIEKMEA